jgi:hypothetical protein
MNPHQITSDSCCENYANAHTTSNMLIRPNRNLSFSKSASHNIKLRIDSTELAQFASNSVLHTINQQKIQRSHSNSNKDDSFYNIPKKYKEFNTKHEMHPHKSKNFGEPYSSSNARPQSLSQVNALVDLFFVP